MTVNDTNQIIIIIFFTCYIKTVLFSLGTDRFITLHINNTHIVE